MLAASHHTLQLPAIARVTNLENGRQLLLRLNDRGPDDPGRLLGLTRHAADLLGVADGTQIRVELEPDLTRALTDQVGGGPKLDVAAAPRAAVAAEALPPPPGTGQSGARAAGGSNGDVTAAAPAASARCPTVCPTRSTRAAPAPGSIVLRASEFGRVDYANRVAAQLTGLNPAVERMTRRPKRRATACAPAHSRPWRRPTRRWTRLGAQE